MPPMHVLLWIIVANLCGGALSVVCAAAFALNTRVRRYLDAVIIESTESETTT